MGEASISFFFKSKVFVVRHEEERVKVALNPSIIAPSFFLIW